MEWSAKVGEFTVRHGDVTITLLVTQIISESKASGSFGLVHGRPTYATQDGFVAQKIDSRRFRLVATGEVFERLN
jgi:hypothetical protein